MRPRWENVCRKRAEQAAAFGPYSALQTIQTICSDDSLSGAVRLERIRFFLNEIDVIVAQKKEA